MENVIAILPIIAFIAVWVAVARFYKTKGKGAIIRHSVGFAVGFLALIIGVILVAPNPKNTDTPTTQTEQASKMPDVEKSLEKNVVKEESKAVEKSLEIVKEQPPQVTEKQPEAPKKQSKDLEEKSKKVESVQEEPEIVNVEELNEEESANKSVQTIGINIKQFAQRVNSNLKEIDSPYRMPNKPKIEANDRYDMVFYSFSENFSVAITLEKKTHNVISIVTGMNPNANAKENLMMFFSNSALLSAYEGKNKMKVVGKKFILMMNEALEELQKTGKSVTRSFIHNGKKYEIGFLKKVGVMSSASFDE